MIRVAAGPNIGTAAVFLTAVAVVLNPVIPDLPDITVPAFLAPGFTAPSFFSLVLPDVPLPTDPTVEPLELPSTAALPPVFTAPVAAAPEADGALLAEVGVMDGVAAVPTSPTIAGPDRRPDSAGAVTTHPGIPLSPRQIPQIASALNPPAGISTAGMERRTAASLRTREPAFRAGPVGRVPSVKPGPAHPGSPGQPAPPGPAGAMPPGGPHPH